MELRQALEAIEAGGPTPPEAAAALAAAVLDELAVEGPALAGPLRRSLLLLAAGGDPRRELEPHGRAVRALAAEVARLVPPDELCAPFARVREASAGLTVLETVAASLEASPGDAAVAVALALLADELAAEP
jgi:hypothetical protein